MLIDFLHREHNFLSELPSKERGLLAGSFFYALAAPILMVFSNTYLWRQSPDAVVLALFNLGFFGGLPIGFYLNGLLLRRFASSRLYLLGCLLQGFVPIALVVLEAQADEYALALGLGLGVAAGFYWGNRNLLTSRHTAGLKRFKFLSLEMTAVTTASIISPILIGWFLVLGERTGLYAAQSAYEIAALFALIVLVIAGVCVARTISEHDTMNTLTVRRPSRDWNRLRLIEMLHGAVNGLEAVIPIVILLLFVGLEDSVGAVKTYTATLTALSLYAIGRRVKYRHHAGILGIWTVLTTLGRGAFAILSSLAGALLMFTTDGVSGSWRWASATAVMYETVEAEVDGGNGERRYAYIADRELFLNIGRVGMITILVLFLSLAPEATIRYGLLLAILFQIPLVFLTRCQTQHLPPIS